MTDNHEKLLSMAREIASQDNAATHAPIFMVQRHKRTYGFDPAYSEDHTVYLTQDDYYEVDTSLAPTCPKCKHIWTKADVESLTQFDCSKCKEKLSAEERTQIDRDYEECLKCPTCENPLTRTDLDDESCHVCEEDPNCKKYPHFDLSDDLGLTRTAYQDSWENVQPFFTRKGAEEYLRINGHNLEGKEKPRIYVESAYRNAEWIAIRQMLIDLNMTNVLLDEIKAAEAAKT